MAANTTPSDNQIITVPGDVWRSFDPMTRFLGEVLQKNGRLVIDEEKTGVEASRREVPDNHPTNSRKGDYNE